MQKLHGKTALITGGNSGIGLAAAKLFVQHGAQLAITGRNPASLERAQQELGHDVLALRSDAGKVADIDTLMQQVAARFGGLDVLFLNAGVAASAPLEQVTEADFDELVAVNLKGVFFTVQKALPLLRRDASIIVTTSISNRIAVPGASVYAAAKAGLRSLMRCLALELIGRGVRINAISPGPVDTPMFDRMGLPREAVQARKAAMLERSPSRRFGSTDEIAKAVLFLASDDSSYVVGEEIIIDGGMSLR